MYYIYGAAGGTVVLLLIVIVACLVCKARNKRRAKAEVDAVDNEKFTINHVNLEQTEVDDADEGTNGSRLEEVQVKESGKPALEPTQGSVTKDMFGTGFAQETGNYVTIPPVPQKNLAEPSDREYAVPTGITQQNAKQVKKDVNQKDKENIERQECSSAAYEEVSRIHEEERWSPFLLFLAGSAASQWAVCSEMYALPAYLAPLDRKALNGTFYTVLDEFFADSSGSLQSELFSATFFFGALAFGLALPLLADRYGRRLVLIWSLLISAGTGFLSAVAPTFWMLLFARTLQGSVLQALNSLNFVYVSESMHESQVGLAASLFGIFWVFGYVIICPLALLMHHWRALIAFHACISLLIAAVFYLWNGSCSITASDLLRAKQLQTREKESEADRSPLEIMRYLVARPKVLLLLAVATMLWSSSMMTYTALTISSTALAVGNTHWNFVLSGLAELPAYTILPRFMDSFGHKRVTLLIFSGASIFLLCFFFIPQAVNYLLLPIWICSKVFVTAAFLAVLIDGSEDFPIPCRAFCIGIGLTFANFGSMVAPYAVSLDTLAPQLSMLSFGLLMGVSCFLILFCLPSEAAESSSESIGAEGEEKGIDLQETDRTHS